MRFAGQRRVLCWMLIPSYSGLEKICGEPASRMNRMYSLQPFFLRLRLA